MINRCYYCYNIFEEKEKFSPAFKHGYHTKCSKRLFGSTTPPSLPYTLDQMLELGNQVVRSQVTVTGVQTKLSLGIEKISQKSTPKRFTIVGLWGDYILKPPTSEYPHLPENEDLTLKMAETVGIKTVNHGLIKLESGELAYITRREDRIKDKKLHMEDMCQLTERLTEHKYHGSHEKIARTILKYSSNPLFDAINFYEQVIFSFLSGNADMHLKNFSLIKNNNGAYTLCPAYDMVSTALVLNDPEELALTLDGKKRKLKRADFETAMKNCNIPEKTIENTFTRFSGMFDRWAELIKKSFLPEDFKLQYQENLSQRGKQIEIW